jgi:hypothetical protein
MSVRVRVRAERGLAVAGLRVFGGASAFFRAAGASGDFRAARGAPAGRADLAVRGRRDGF